MQVVQIHRNPPPSPEAAFDPARMVPYGYDETDYGTPKREGAAVCLTIDGREVTVLRLTVCVGLRCGGGPRLFG